MKFVPLFGQGGAATSPAKRDNVESPLNVTPKRSTVSLMHSTGFLYGCFQDIKASDVIKTLLHSLCNTPGSFLAGICLHAID